MSSKRHKILIVEEDPDIRRELTGHLENAGYQVNQAVDGAAGYHAAQELVPDIIIMADHMSRLDGSELITKLRQTEFGHSIPLIVLSRRAQREAIYTALKVFDVLLKPIDPVVLLKQVEAALKAPKVRPGKLRRILISGTVDDIMQDIAAQLQTIRCETRTASTGADVLTEVVQFEPHLIILEIPMEDIPSVEMIQTLRRMKQGVKCPILLYSYYRLDDLGSEDIRHKALSIDSEQANCVNAGATQFLGRYNKGTLLNQVVPFLS